jgi:hypothetical protein
LEEIMTKPTLADVCERIAEWQKRNPNAHNVCLATVRWALRECGYRLPVSEVDYAGDYAITCGKKLETDPARWGWKAIPLDNLPDYALCFFTSTNPAGHVAVYKKETNHIVSDVTFDFTPAWQKHLVYAFVLE